MRDDCRKIPIATSIGGTLSGLVRIPSDAKACFVFAHGAGAGFEHPFMEVVARGLAERQVATLRYQFPYMEKGERRPDPAPVCHRAVRAAVGTATELMPALPLFAGGKSFGGRMTSQSQAAAPLPQVRGLCFFGFPLHAARRPSVTRAEHLSNVRIPMLFLQGTRDALADTRLMHSVVTALIAPVTMKLVESADHSFHVLARSGMTDKEIMRDLLDAFVEWTQEVIRST